MKKIIALLTALMLCAAMLMGCGKEADIGGKTTPLNDPAATTEPTAEPEAEPEEEHKLTLGRMEGGTYENSYAGFGCILDSDWTFYGAEEIQEIPDEVKEVLADSELSDEVADFTGFTDMMSENTEMMANMNVVFAKMSLKERLACAMLSEENILDATLAQSDKLLETFTQIGITNVTTLGKVDVNFLGETHKALYTEGEMYGVEVYMVQVFDYTRGQYSVTLTVGSYVEDRTQDILDLFYKVE